jgi:SAM-dependent methyltransferase
MATVYDKAFFEEVEPGVRSSALVVVPLLVEMFSPKSVVDVGAGVGMWAAEFLRAGVPDVIGVDGDYIDRAALEIPRERFVSANLERPLELGREFDLVVSLEVAEHLPDSSARTFIGSLARLGPVVAFSAAIPGQGGTNHVNERWPEYWVELFREHGFRAYDPLRRKLWNDQRVAHCYRQNLLVFVREGHVVDWPWDAGDSDPNPAFGVVHPEVYQFFRDREDDWNRMRIPQALRIAMHLPHLIVRSLAFRIRHGRSGGAGA